MMKKAALQHLAPAAQTALIPALCLGAVLATTSCSRGYHPTYHNPVDYVTENEVNDLVEEANYLGTLSPGDRIVISGSITDIPFDPFHLNNGHDPFDGFAFVANVPIHVEFRLIANSFADLDLCVYDPVTDTFEFCFETTAHPEVGALDVLSGGSEFHLVVESFIGSGSYELEIEVEALYNLEMAEGFESLTADATATGSASALRGDVRATPAPEGRASGYIEKAVIDANDVDTSAAEKEALEALRDLAAPRSENDPE